MIEATNTFKNSQDFIENKISELTLLKSDVENLRKALQDQKTEFNFIGLSDGFKTFKNQKQQELQKEESNYKWLMWIIITLITIKLFGSIWYLLQPEPNLTMLIVTSISAVLLILILLYFFKISLTNIKSIKSQILQIDLRLTLCQFIHNYNKDSASLRGETMRESLNKFESVIFAPIVATDDKMPATFEGIDQLTGLIGLINKEK